MKIYRVETNDGYGPYSYYGEGYNEFRMNIYTSRYHPSPYSDNIQSFNGCHSFGFQSIDQLREWFDHKSRKYLNEHGFKVSVYRVNKRKAKVIIGGKQVAFDKSKATLKERIDILSI